jgi:hypothetical protein
MPIIRGHHNFDGQFTQIPNAWLRDARLSYKARGLLSELMSHTPGFEVSRERLSKNGQDGDRAIRSAIRELEDVGYLKRSQNRTEQNQFGVSVWVTQDPDLPSVPFAPAGNAPAGNAEVKKIIEKNTKELNKSSSNFDQLFSEFWQEYPRKKDKGSAFKAFKSAMKRAKFEQILVGATAYANDPTRKPEYTKFPATWLNADAWENEISPAPGSEAAERSRVRRERELELTREFLKEQDEAAKNSAANKLCEHGVNVARCQKCLATMAK